MNDGDLHYGQAHNSHGDSTHDQTSACALACAGSAVRRDNENSHDNYFAGVGRYSPVDGTAAPASLPGLPTASVDAALYDALREAAESLNTIAVYAGKNEYLSDEYQIRGYANNRANVARAALAKAVEPPKAGQ